MFGKTEKAALKYISIPQNEGDIDNLYANGYDDDGVTAHFKDTLEDIVREYSMMVEIKGHTNVVYCDDIRYIQHDDGFGWDIFIKMELLTPMPKALGMMVCDEEVIKIGKDICNALVLCKSKGIVHRDIKPQNIFVSDTGDYKLGDFGIAKTVERTTGGTQAGTLAYMAPEVANFQPYGTSADIYSLGLVLYWLLNERRLPFLPLPPEKIKFSMDEEARKRRLMGEPLPAPAHGSENLKRIVLKACAYDPKDRYRSAAEMLRELNEGFGSETERRKKEEEEQQRRHREEQERLQREKEEQERQCKAQEEKLRKAREEQERIQRELAAQERLRKEKETQEQKKEKKPAGNKKRIVAIVLVVMCLICGALFFSLGGQKTGTQISQTKSAVEKSSEKMQALDRNVVEGSSNILSENFEGILFDFSAQERNMIEGIRFYKTLKNVPEMAKDVSQNKDGSVRAWVEDACLHIAGNGKVVAPENCKGLFSGYGKARSIYFLIALILLRLQT